ncbi:anti-sigma factor family protein [Paenirhodobacter sp.]|uniref:anti-sigma factor family protein n=1 Tax=Paenirhodobacter sp. TaxID=1965326 RepID=UPI003B3CD264
MTTDHRIDPLLLHAFADGALSPEDAARVVIHLADHPEDQQEVDRIMALNAMLARACSGPMSEPVPEAIRRTIFGGPRRAGGGWQNRLVLAGMALAAAVAVVALLPPTSGMKLVPGLLSARSPVAQALDEIATGAPRLVAEGTALSVLASFRVEGGYCREFALRDDADEQVGLACTGAEGWTLRAHRTVAAPETAEGYVPAAGEAGDPIGEMLETLGAGPALTPQEEQQARDAAWR